MIGKFEKHHACRTGVQLYIQQLDGLTSNYFIQLEKLSWSGKYLLKKILDSWQLFDREYFRYPAVNC